MHTRGGGAEHTEFENLKIRQNPKLLESQQMLQKLSDSAFLTVSALD